MSRYEDGQYMNLTWDGTPDAYYIMGHVSHFRGVETLIDEGVIEDDSRIGQAEHKYGRWSMEPGENGNQHFLREYCNPGRGHFKITVFGVGIFAKKGNVT
ncbi:hypothetical protein LCGC14_2134670 [marine sediment metagenome]|uniref:Uncharacterized protein n=1 Tax=marine sediment metagenome TaxID=412755 RepID=A0A0F9GDD0_9ZZZZ